MTLCDRFIDCRSEATVFALRASRWGPEPMLYQPTNLCRMHAAQGNLLKFKTEDARRVFLCNEALNES